MQDTIGGIRGNPEGGYGVFICVSGADGDQVAIIKTSTSGRISFTRESDGKYKVLKDADFVVHVTPLAGTGNVRISLFARQTIIDAFDVNHAAKVARGMEHVPSWLNPVEEPGWRLTGSGFMTQAYWSEIVALDGPASADEHLASEPNVAEKGIMDRIREMLAEHMGVKPELIEIDVRVKM